jgi:hypothetical protein
MLPQVFQDALADGKAEAERVIAEELIAEMRERLPRFVERMKRGTNTKDPVRRALSETINDIVRENRSFAFRLMVGSIARQRLWRHVRDEVKREIKGRDVVIISDVVDKALESCAIVIPLYPQICRPKLPRRIDVARLVHRYCKRGWQ